MIMTVDDLSRKQMRELKERYLFQLQDSGELEEITGYDKLYLALLIAADDVVPDDVIYRNYDGVTFTEDDFTNC